MYQNCSQSVIDAIMSDSRCFRAKLEFVNGLVISAESIFRFDTSGQSSSQEIAPGQVISQGVNIEIADLDKDITGQTFDLSIYPIDAYAEFEASTSHADLSQYGLNELAEYAHYDIARLGSIKHEPIPIGRYRVTSCKQQGSKWSVEAHDGLYSADKTYTPGISFPCTVFDVECEICNQLGIGLPTEKSLIVLTKAVEGATQREMLGYCASLDGGKFAVLDRNGNLVHRWYTDSGYEITSGRSDEPETAQSDIIYTQISCSVDNDTTYYFGSIGRCMGFANPYITQSKLDSIGDNLIGFTYRPMTINHRLGDPRLDVWDIVTVTQFNGTKYKCPVMSLAYAYDGGLSASIAATGNADPDKGSNDGPVTRSVKKLISIAKSATEQKLMESMRDSVDYITGANGGYVITELNADGQPTATYYTDNLDKSKANNVLLINNRGILGTNDGINGVYKVAITNDGRINASQILTGILSAIVLQSTNYSKTAGTGSKIDLEDGTFSFAGGKLVYNGNKLEVSGKLVSTSDTAKAVIDDSYIDFIKSDGTDFERTMRLNDSGAHFYRDGNNLGFMGTNKVESTGKRGIVFDLETDGDYMSWGYKKNASDDTYTQAFTFYRDEGFSFRGNTVSNAKFTGISFLDTELFSNGIGIKSEFTIYNDVSCNIYSDVDFHNYDIINADISTTSDERLKDNIKPSEVNALEIMNRLNPVSFDWKTDGSHEKLGYIAQEVESVEKNFVNIIGNDTLAIKYTKIIPYLIKAIQELSDKVDSLERMCNNEQLH